MKDRLNLVALVAIGFALIGLQIVLNVAQAQTTIPGAATVSWVLPTAGCTSGVSPCDNVPLTGISALTAVEVYISTSPIADTSAMTPTLTLAAGATTTTQTLQVSNGATLYARVKAVTAGGKSAFSTQVTKLVAIPAVPGVPTSVTLTIQLS